MPTVDHSSLQCAAVSHIRKDNTGLSTKYESVFDCNTVADGCELPEICGCAVYRWLGPILRNWTLVFSKLSLPTCTRLCRRSHDNARKVRVWSTVGCYECDVCWRLPGQGSAKKWDRIQSLKSKLWQYALCFFLFYCSGGTSIANTGRLLTTSGYFRNSRRTSGLCFLNAQTQHSLFTFRHHATLL